MNEISFDIAFAHLTGHPPFPWQRALYEKFIADDIPQSCNLPTGLGKTSVIAVWLIALANHPDKMPQRLVYVVNRRTVVDQTTEEVERYKANKVPGIPDFAISTLRGQFADNREWSADPSRPAVISGTVDMIGSRLLFSGYGVGMKGRPLHAGFLGQDVLLVHDEAHLEPAFQDLVKAIEGEQKRCKEFRPFRVMELTATLRSGGEVFELTERENAIPPELPAKPSEPIHHVWQRMKSKKGLRFHPAKRDSVATRIGEIARDQWKDSGKAILVFVRTIDDVKTVKAVLTDKKGGMPEDQVQQLTGTMRGRERDALAAADLVFARFSPAPKVVGKEGTVYLICTSAGEVGVDISADHMVCDLSTLDSMAQRFGRVNRRGEGAALIDAVFETDANPKPSSPAFEAARWETKKVLERLPRCGWTEERYDASPSALGALMKSLTEAERKAAFAPTPTILPVTDILFDAWALTTIRDKLPGRPKLEPYLHGITEWQPPETHVAWREEVGVITGDLLELYSPSKLIEEYPLLPHELLREPSHRAFKHFEVIAKRRPDDPAWLLDDDGKITKLTMKQLADKEEKDRINGKTVLLAPAVGGLENGMLNGTSKLADDVADTAERKRRWDPEEAPDRMRKVLAIEIPGPDGDEGEAGRSWQWFEIANEGGRSAWKPVDWSVHVGDVVKRTREIVARLPLSEEIARAVVLAAEWHDHGKKRKLFQAVLGNARYPDVILAKSGRRGGRLQEKYRHEFGSLLDVEQHPEWSQLSSEQRDLVLHLIAAHHGRARPHFCIEEVFDPERKQTHAEVMAVSVPQRFARLQRKYGRWGLAYLESLLRAADWAASAEPSEYLEERP
jgi:CRISPR-associated endonuclease/helicase Cas3